MQIRSRSNKLTDYHSLKAVSCLDANSVVTGGTACCRHDNLCCLQWQQSWPNSQTSQCTSPISHNAPFCNINVRMCAHFCYKMVHYGIPLCIVGFVWWVYWFSVVKCRPRACTKPYLIIITLFQMSLHPLPTMLAHLQAQRWTKVRHFVTFWYLDR